MSIVKTARDNYFILDGHSSLDWGMVVSGDNVYDAPARDVDRISVPGRNGDLIIDNGRWENVDVTYNDCLIDTDFPEKFADFRSQVAKMRGYVRLEDSFNPDEYRMASLSKGIKVEKLGTRYHSGKFDLTFNCKPQRFLKSGERPIQLIPPIAPGFGTARIYIEEGNTVEVTCVSTDATLTIDYELVDSSVVSIETDSYTLAEGETITITPSTTGYWQIEVSDYTSADEVALRIKTTTAYNGTVLPVDAVFAQTYWITNPTGYRARPLLEFYNWRGASFALRNYTDGTRTDSVGWAGFDTGTYHFYVDCDLCYSYDDDGNNLTDKLFISESGGIAGRSLNFPSLGENDIKIYMYNTYKDINSPGIINLYPRWYRI